MGPMGAMGLTLATSIASFTGAMIMLGLLHKKIGKMNFRRSMGQFVKIALATGVCLAAVLAVHGLVPLSNTGFAANVARLLLSVGVGLLVRGFRARRTGTVNAGLLVVFALILLRFFDEDLGFAVRGVVFVLLGLAFLAVNLVLARRKGAAS